MSLLGSILRRRETRATIENPSIPLSQADDTLYEAFGSQRSRTGMHVSLRRSLTIATVFACVRLIAEDVAKIPLLLHEREGNGKRRALDHDVYRILTRAPNEWQDSMMFLSGLMAHALLWGNAYSLIERDRAGRPVSLVLLDPSRTMPVRVDRTVFYWHQLESGPELKIASEDILHIANVSLDGLAGLSVVGLARESFGVALAAQAHGAAYFRNAATPRVALMHPGILTKEAADRIRTDFERRHTGVDQAHRPAILEEGMKIEAYSMSSADAQFLETRQFEVREIATWFGVPPHKVGDPERSSYASLESENQSYLDSTLDHWLVRIERQGEAKLLLPEERDVLVIEFLRQAVLRLDSQARSAYYSSGLQGGWLSRDEVRGFENLNPLPDGQGQTFFVPLNVGLTAAVAPAPAPAAPVPTPAIPAPSPAGPAPVDAAQAGRFRDGALAVVRDAAERIARRLYHALERAAKKPESFLDAVAVGALEVEHGAAVREILGPALAVARALSGRDADIDVKSALGEVGKRAAGAATGAAPGTLAAAVEGLKGPLADMIFAGLLARLPVGEDKCPGE